MTHPLPGPLQLRCASSAINISDFPEELLTEVFLNLDNDGILAMKQTCKAFYYITQSRQLWYEFVKDLQIDQIRRPEQPLEEYSTRELEKWVCRRLRAQARWKATAPPITHQFTWNDVGPSTSVAYSCILPGARWLIILTLTEEVYSVDLDAPRPKANPLFKWDSFNSDGRLDGLAECCYWVDDRKPRLTFRMGLCGAVMTPGSGDSMFTRIILFQGELKGHGSGATLVTDPLAIMKSVGIGTRPQTCLNADYFVEFLRCPRTESDDGLPYHLRSYNYRIGGTGQGDVRPFILPLENSIKHMEFISNNRIVAFDIVGAQIFSILPSENDVQHTVSLIYTISMSASMSFSPLYRTLQSTYKVVIFGGGEVRGVEISDRDPTAAVVKKLGHQEYHWRTDTRAAIGRSMGVFIRRDGFSMDLLSYSWEDGDEIAFTRRTHSTGGSELPKSVVLSDDLSRVVVHHRNGISLFG